MSLSDIILFFGFFLILAILICAENSFWHQSQASPFFTTFSDAFHLYQTSGTMMRIESALNQLGESPTESVYYWRQKTHQQMEYDAQFTEIILAHLLGVFHFFYLDHIFLTFYKPELLINDSLLLIGAFKFLTNILFSLCNPVTDMVIGI